MSMIGGLRDHFSSISDAFSGRWIPRKKGYGTGMNRIEIHGEIGLYGGSMQFFLYVSQLIIPFLILYIVGYGLLANVPVYDSFIRGAKEGMNTVMKIAPTLVGLMIASGVLRASGFLDLVGTLLGRIIPEQVFPAELVPLGVLRMFSSSAATGLLLDVYKEFGTDSRIGLIASLMMSCTETIFYTMSLYFMTAGVKKTRYTLTGALLATVAGIAASVVLAGAM